MESLNVDSIAHLGWGTFVQRLTETLAGGSPESELRDGLKRYFGADEERIRTLASRALQLRAGLPTLGNVVFVHGTMCADLSVTGPDGSEELLWMNLPRISAGHIEQLTLNPSGQDRDPGLPIKACGINKLAYAATLLWLHGRWNVRPFAYDWRKDQDVAADALAGFIQENFSGEPVHLLAHSMGGIVCRNFIRRHGQLWRDMRDVSLRRGGRLVMLGTPNYGTYLATQAMSGQSELVWALESMDLRHSRDEILAIVNSFVANYQMLPSPARLTASEQTLYRPEQWGALPISEAHLERGREFHEQLETPAALDPERLLYVAGYGYETPTKVTFTSTGELDHAFSVGGDGVTTLELGPLPGVPTWFVYANHFELAFNPRVLAAADELLSHGTTRLLARRPAPFLSARSPVPHRLHILGRTWIDYRLREVSRRISRREADAAERFGAERVLTWTLLGERRFFQSLWELERPRVLDWIGQASAGA